MQSTLAGATPINAAAESEPLAKILRVKANRGLAKRAAASYSIFFIYVIVVSITPIFSNHSVTAIICGALVAAALLWRMWISRSAQPDECFASTGWVTHYAIATMFMSFVWAGFTTLSFYYYHTEWIFFLVLVSTAGIAAAATISLSPNAWLARAYVLVMILAPLTSGLVDGSRSAVTMAILMGLYIVVLLMMIKDSHRAFWNNLATIEKINTQNVRLEKVISETARNSGLLKEASIQLSGASDRMSHGAESMAAETEQTARTAAEFKGSSQNVAATMEDLNEQARQIVHAIEGLVGAIDTVTKTTRDTHAVAQQAVAQSRNATQMVSRLGQSSQEVGKVSEAIREISEQTNLLALNATIEAARAGEAGKGF